MYARFLRLFIVLSLAGNLLIPLTGAGSANPPFEEDPGGFFNTAPGRAEATDPTSGGDFTELVGQTGGAFFGVDVVGALAYATYGQRLAVLDVSNPANPILVGKSGVMTGEAYALEVAGNYAYLASPGVLSGSNWIGGAMRVVDVSDPSNPDEKVYFWAGGMNRAPFDIALYGDYAFLVDLTNLWVVNISNPLAPSTVTRFAVPEISPISLTVDQHPIDSKVYAYVVGYGGKMKVIDVTTPASPSVVGSYTAPNDAVGVAVQGEYAYVAAYDTFKVVAISNPASPSEAGSMAETDAYYSNVLVEGSYAYVQNGRSLETVSISNPAIPSEVGSLQMPSGMTMEGYKLDLTELSGQITVYIPDDTEGLRLVDASVPTAPTDVGVYNEVGHVNDVVRQGDRAYITVGSEVTGGSRLRILEYTAPGTTQELGSLDIMGRIDSVVGGTAFLLKNPITSLGHIGKLQLVDVSNPASPQPRGAFETNRRPEDVAVWGNFAYLANDWDGLRVLGITDTLTINQVSQITYTQGTAEGVDVSPSIAQPGKTFAYLAVAGNSSADGLRIVDVSDPSSPVEAGNYDPGGDPRLVAVYRPPAPVPPALENKDLIVVTFGGLFDDENYIHLVDVSNPAIPVQLSVDIILEPALDLLVSGNYAYVAAGFYSLSIFDLPDLTLFESEAGTYRLPTEGFGAAVDGNFVSIAAGKGGLFTTWFGPGFYEEFTPTGGMITSSFDATTYTFPPGTFSGMTYIEHRPRYQGNITRIPGKMGIQHFFEIDAEDDENNPVEPNIPYNLTIQYQDEQLGGWDEGSIGLYYWDGTSWQSESTAVLDTSTNTVSATPDHFSLWGLMVDTQDLFLPLMRRD